MECNRLGVIVDVSRRLGRRPSNGIPYFRAADSYVAFWPRFMVDC